MSDQRGGGISWTDQTWNPIRGCSRVNASCIHCYAEGVAIRFSKPGLAYEGLVRLSTTPGQGDRAIGWNGVVRMVPEHLADPLRWKRPRRIFVNSMSDLFHEALPFADIAAIFETMAQAPRHTFQVLTKRPERMRHFMEGMPAFALPHIHLGVSVGNQDEADDFIPELLDTPSAVRWVSYEPAHGPVNFHAFLRGALRDECLAILRRGDTTPTPGLDWIVVGGESGKGARPFDLAWAESTVEQCRAAGVPVFVKQLGAHPIDATEQDVVGPDGSVHYTREAGNELLTEAAQRPGYSIVPHRVRFKDRAGADPWEWPRELWVQEFPR